MVSFNREQPCEVLVISDIHANLTALEEVLADAERQKWLDRTGFDAVWSLGDIVGYGPRPNECIRRLQQFEGHLRVAGNHDWAALDRLDIDEFNPKARKMVVWTRNQLDSSAWRTCSAFPTTHRADPRRVFHRHACQPAPSGVGIRLQHNHRTREFRLL